MLDESRQTNGIPEMESEGLMLSKRELLEQALRARRSNLPAQGTRTISRRSTQGPVDLSFAQQRLWIIEQLYPGNGAYIMAECLHLRGRLDREALEYSLFAIVQRHGILRTTFDLVADRPRQHVSAAEKWSLPVYDLSNVPASEQEQEIRRHILAELQKTVDLRAGPLFHRVLFYLTPESHMLYLQAHHIIWD